MKNTDTATQLLDTAQELVQARGYNAFSYRDLAETVGIRTASIHYHFKSKSDLGIALMERYIGTLAESLARIDVETNAYEDKLLRFIDLYRQTEKAGAICLCGSLAADSETLPGELKSLVSDYLDRSEAWLTAVLQKGIDSGEFKVEGRVDEVAGNLLASLQGGLILSRARGGQAIIDTVEAAFRAQLQAD